MACRTNVRPHMSSPTGPSKIAPTATGIV
jgi:hypothetical protein